MGLKRGTLAGWGLCAVCWRVEAGGDQGMPAARPHQPSPRPVHPRPPQSWRRPTRRCPPSRSRRASLSWRASRRRRRPSCRGCAAAARASCRPPTSRRWRRCEGARAAELWVTACCAAGLLAGLELATGSEHSRAQYLPLLLCCWRRRLPTLPHMPPSPTAPASPAGVHHALRGVGAAPPPVPLRLGLGVGRAGGQGGEGASSQACVCVQSLRVHGARQASKPGSRTPSFAPSIALPS